MKTKRKQPLLALMVIFGVSLGCSFFTKPQSPAVLPPLPSLTPEICSTNPPDLRIEVIFEKRDLEGQLVMVKGMGFNPGEKLTIRITGQGKEHGVKIETLEYPAKANGSFLIEENLQLDDPTMQWEVHVLHQRGIACLRFGTAR